MSKAQKTTSPPFGSAEEWSARIKRTIKRFARGNIAAQNGRILLPEEQEKESKEMRAISAKWKARYKS
jgi:hypothetical protein